MKRWTTHPVFLCGFRPFFFFSGIAACALMGWWLLSLSGVPAVAAWQPSGGPMLWHACELILGFGMAAVAGFLLTAVPEFTGSEPQPASRLLCVAVLWLLARLAWLPAAWLPWGVGIGLLATLNLGFTAGLLALLLPALWRDRTRRHLSFGWALLAMLAVEAGFFLALYRHGDPMAWLLLAIGLMMVLIVIAGSRISMNVVNRLVEAGRPGLADHETVGYLARPPRRNFAVFCICLFSGVEFLKGHDLVTGWLALAAAAAMFNLLNDWHVGRALLYRWALILYAGYWLVALGYAGIGLAMLGAPWTPSSGRHLLLVGAMGLSIFTVMNIAGRIHAGLWLDDRRWVPLAAAMLVLAALLRWLAGWFAMAQWSAMLLLVAGLLWMAAFALYLCFSAAILLQPRTDGQQGCAEPLTDAQGPQAIAHRHR
ncbi:NnrS family protein [Corticibacter populi]|nr:NnrS family protein [Corticibacter populi]